MPRSVLVAADGRGLFGRSGGLVAILRCALLLSVEGDGGALAVGGRLRSATSLRLDVSTAPSRGFVDGDDGEDEAMTEVASGDKAAQPSQEEEPLDRGELFFSPGRPLFDPKDIARAARAQLEAVLPAAAARDVIQMLTHPDLMALQRSFAGSWKFEGDWREEPLSHSSEIVAIFMRSQRFNFHKEKTSAKCDVVTEIHWIDTYPDMQSFLHIRQDDTEPLVHSAAMADAVVLEPVYGPHGIGLRGAGRCFCLSNVLYVDSGSPCEYTFSHCPDGALRVDMSYVEDGAPTTLRLMAERVL